MFIRSERLFLRPGWPEDLHELQSRLNDSQVARNLARIPWPYTAHDARALTSTPQDARCPHFLITLPTSARPADIIGCVGLARIDGQTELGYWIARGHWGNGYASEAVRAVTGLSRTLGHRRLVAGHYADNPASGRVLVKAGFKPTGQVRLRFSLARGEDVLSIEHGLELAEPGNCDDPAGMRVA